MNPKSIVTAVSVLAAILLVCPSHAQNSSPDNSSIPPDILRQMDPDLVSGKRPRVVTIKQDDIFGLRDNPRRDADFVTFDLDIAKLSTAQRNILDAWLRAGHNKLLLVADQIPKYDSLFGVSAGWMAFVSGKPSYEYALSEHPVSTDCGNLSFGEVRDMDNNRSSWAQDQRYVVYRGHLVGLDTEKSRILVTSKSDSNKAFAGAFSFGRSTVYFHGRVGGPDMRRWYLNFYHWALDLRVPGAAETGTTVGATGVPVPKTQDDVVVQKNGDKITGEVKNKSFTIKTSYATLTFDRNKVDFIVLEGAGFNTDEIVLKTGDKLSGVLQDPKIAITLSSGAETELDKDKVKEIRILKTPDDEKK